jgi:hypothetical protein
MRASRSALASARSGTARSAVTASGSVAALDSISAGDHPLLHGAGQIGQAPSGVLGRLLPAALLMSEQGSGDLAERQGLHVGVLRAAAFGFQHGQQRLRLDRQHRFLRLAGASRDRDAGQVRRRSAAGRGVGPHGLAEPAA